MEEVVTGYASYFEERLSDGSLDHGGSCPAKNSRAFPQPFGPQFVESCDEEDLYRQAWDSSVSESTFVNPQTQTCARAECNINKDEFGINLPEALTTNHYYGPNYADFSQESGRRACNEIAATNDLLPKFQESHEKYPDLKWNFMGMQETGLYRNWPLIYQCRTESQCTGCSDPRFRSWYAESASGPKDVVLVLDTSGSMRSVGRADAMREAAKWVSLQS
jgi:hypothetical protein